MNNELFFSLCCDTDPDTHIRERICVLEDQRELYWQGISRGVGYFRNLITKSPALSDDLPITWLLRADRQIIEAFGEPAYCYKRFSNIWDKELKNGSEIGWHPHLYLWNKNLKRWIPRLGKDDDCAVLGDCLESMRQYCDVRSVRTGWDYHSNTLMRFFNEKKIIVDASALPGCYITGEWYYDWRGSHRKPYRPSREDYRVASQSVAGGMNIVEIPCLVRRLSFPVGFGRFLKRLIHSLTVSDSPNIDWYSAFWQGIIASRVEPPFSEAVEQTIRENISDGELFFASYFHTDDLLNPKQAKTVVNNMEAVLKIGRKWGYNVTFITLDKAGSRWGSLHKSFERKKS